jgi:hypothetical protein
MKFCTTTIFVIAFVPAVSEAKAPHNLRRLDGAFNGDDQGRYGYGGHPDNSEFLDESHRSNQMMGGPDGSEFFGDFDHSNQMMGGGGGEGGGGPQFVAIECDATNVCDRPDGDVGIWVCRTMTRPVTGEALSRAICIPNNHAWNTGKLKVNLDLEYRPFSFPNPISSSSIVTSDECGCCLDETGVELECPVLPDFITLQCANNTQPDMPHDMPALQGSWQHNASHGSWQHHASHGSWQHNASNLTNMMDSSDRQFICRDLINPFSGEPQPTTLFVPQDRAIDGDICGCCNGNCSFSAEHMFERPPFVEKSCAAETDNYITCELPSRANGGHGNVTEGFFVCRELFDPHGQGESRKEALCIHGDRAFETDECGCCGQECLQSPTTASVTTQQAATSAESSGAFARSLGTLISSILIAGGMGMLW